MDPALSLESAALKLCRQAMGRSAVPSGDASAHATSSGVHLNRVFWLLPDLARLIATQHERSPHDFALRVRRFVDEHTFVEDAGDPMFDERVNDEAQTLINVSLRVHRAVHHQAAARDRWHDAPVPPLMCG